MTVRNVEAPTQRRRSRSHDFAKLWLAQGTSALGSQVTFLAVPAVAAFDLHSSAREVSALAAADYIAFPVCGLLSGVLADRLDRRKLLMVASLAAGLSVGAVPVAYALGHLTYWLLLVAVAVTGGARVLVDICAQATVTQLVEPEALSRANARMALSGSSTELGGPTLAGLLLLILNAASALVVDSCSYFLSAVLFFFVKAELVPAKSERSSLKHDLLRGWGLIRNERGLRLLLIVSLLLTVGDSLGAGVLPIFAYRQLGLSVSEYGLILAFGGAGGLLGASVLSRLTAKFGESRVLLAGLLGSALANGLIPCATIGRPVVVLAFAALAFSVSLVLFNVTALTLRQRYVDSSEQGRLSATFRTLVWTCAPPALILGGVVAGSAGYVAVFVASAVVTGLALLYAAGGILR